MEIVFEKKFPENRFARMPDYSTIAISATQSRSIYGLNSHLPPWNNTLKSDLVLEFSIKARAQERY